MAIQAITADPEDGDGYASLGRACLGLNEPAEAKKQFRAAIERSAENAWYLRCLAMSLKVQNRFGESLLVADKLVELYPNDFENFVNRANIRLMSNQYTEASADYLQALSLNPDANEAHAGLGDSCLGKQQFREGEFHHRKAIALRPTWAYVLNNLRVCLERQGKLKDAALAYKAAVLVDPQLKVAKENTKSALDRYLGVGVGSIAFLIWCIFNLATRSRSKNDSDSLLFLVFGGAVGVLVLSYFFRYFEKPDRRDELALEDPDLLEIYEKIKRDKERQNW